MSLKLVVPAALALPKNDSAVTTHFGTDFASRITFNRAPQGMAKPYMTLVVGAVDYDPTVDESIASAVYRIDYLLYTDTAELGLTIMEELRDAIRTATHDDFDIRLLDEDYFVDVDGVHRITLSSTWRETVTRSTRSFANVIDGDGTSHQVTTGHTYTCLALPNDPLFADDYPDVEAIYSLRQMRRQYRGSAVRVRRGGDNAELGIGFDNDGELDTRALEAFVTATGDNTAFVKIWYDQTGNNNHLTQEDMSKQPQIVASGSVLLEAGKPTVKFDGVNDDLRNGDESIMNGSELTIVTVAKPTEDFSDYEESLVQRTILDQSGTSNGAEFKSVDANQKVTVLSRFDGTAVELNDNVSRLNQRSLYFANYKSGESKLSVNTSEVSTSATSFTAGGNTGVTFSLGSDGAGNTSFYKGNMQEVIVFNTEQTSSKVGIESDLQQYYSVYTPISSGLLDTHSNAHVGFSLRQLDVNYTGPCLEVRRDSDNTIKDIGFLVDGSLNVAQLLDFCGTGDGFVRTWYDQSGNGYDAVQNTHSIQPRIVNDGAVEKNERGALCVNFLEGVTGGFSQGPRFEDIGPDIDTVSHTAFGVITGHDNEQETGRRSIYSFGPTPVYHQFEVTLWETKLIQAFVGEGDSNYASVAPFGYVHDSRSHILTSRYDAVNFNLRIDNIERIDYSLTKEASGSLNLASRNAANLKITEFILYPSIKSDSDCDSIEDNMNDYWNVWTPFTTGILDTHDNAAFAYSFRRLNSAYTGPLISVQRSGGQNYNIGAERDGTLNISEVRRTMANQQGKVLGYFDQSGNGRNMLQTDFDFQGEIIPAGALKPHLDDEGNVYAINTGTKYNSPISLPQPWTAVATVQHNASFQRVMHSNNLYWSPDAANMRISVGTQLNGNLRVRFSERQVFGLLANTTSTKLTYNGVDDSTGDAGSNTGTTDVRILSAFDGFLNSGPPRAYEIIVYDSDESAAFRDIERDMGAHYKVGHVKPMDIAAAEDAVGAYSLRKVRDDWGGPCIRVRKDDGDANTEDQYMDIGFDAYGHLDVVALKNFVGSDDGRVAKWYDQSGRNNHAFQNTLIDQPYIVNAGVVVTSEQRPALEFKSDGQVLDMTHTDYVPSVAHLDMYVVADTGDDTTFLLFSGTAGGSGGRYSWVAKEDATDETDQYNTSHPYAGFGTPDLFVDGVDMNFVFGTNNRADVHDYIGGRHLHVTQEAETNSHWSAFLLNGYNSSGSSLSTVGKFQEIFIFNQDNSANRVALEENITKYYDLGHPTLLDIDGPSSAEACFSLRLMRKNNQNSVCMRVRRDGQSGTTNIYWDEFGNLDVAALEAYANGQAVYVKEWLDQSVNGNHFTQTIEANQPQICDDSGNVFRQNNHPAVKFVQANGSVQSYMDNTTLDGILSMDTYVVRNPTNEDYIMFHGGNQGEGPFSYVVSDQDGQTGIDSNWRRGSATHKIYYNGTDVPIVSGTTDRKDLFDAMVNDELALEVNEGCSTGTSNWQDFRLCGYYGRGLDGFISEIIIFDSDRSAHRTTIQDNINDYYHLY